MSTTTVTPVRPGTIRLLLRCFRCSVEYHLIINPASDGDDFDLVDAWCGACVEESDRALTR